MSEGEHKVADTQGKFAQAVKDGRTVNDVQWTNGRILLSNKRLVLVGNEGKRTIPLAEIRSLDDRHDVNQMIAQVSNYISLRVGEDVVLVSPADPDTFEEHLYGALLDREVVLARHPAVEGGVVQDTDWQKGRLKVADGELDVAMADGTFVEIPLDDIGGIEAGERTAAADEKRTVLEVEHTEEGTSVQTYLSGSDRHVALMRSLLREGEQRSETNVDLDDREREILVALYSGVSPFEIPDFVGMDVEEVEETFERLIELDILEEVRIRREVALQPRGRNIASKAMNER